MRHLILVFGLFLASCGSSAVGPAGSLVGGPCSTDRQCNESCYADKHYPGGMCTVHCRSDLDCPGGTACVEEDENICVAICVNNASCAAFGRGFVCDARDRVGSAGGALVCRVP